jgi:hypothetical protein
VAGLLRDIGIVKCNMGDLAAGCHLMEEAMSLYEWKSTTGSDDKPNEISNGQQATKIAEVSVLANVNLYVLFRQLTQMVSNPGSI